MAITYGIKVIFGIPPKAEQPTLPPGWRSVYRPDGWASAFDPNGQEFFIGPQSCWKMGRATQEQLRGRFSKVGDPYIDSEEIPIANLK